MDHRLVREHLLKECDPCAWALYLLLVTVADAHGLSYYCDASVSRILRVDLMAVAHARQQLIQSDLIAYKKPLYQVLDLEPSAPSTHTRRGEALSVAGLLKKVLGGEV